MGLQVPQTHVESSQYALLLGSACRIVVVLLACMHHFAAVARLSP